MGGGGGQYREKTGRRQIQGGVRERGGEYIEQEKGREE